MPNILTIQVTETDGDLSADGFINETITVVTDEAVSMEWIYNHARTPKEHQELAHHRGFYWQRITPKRIKRLVWELACVATPLQVEPIPENPLARPAVITCQGNLVTEPTNFDWKGRPITTTAGEFIGGVERERGVMVYQVSKNIATDPPWLDAYLGAVNLDPVKLRGVMRPAGTLKLLNPNLSGYDIENKTRFCVFSFDLLYDPLGHHAERWNAGTLQLRAIPLFDGARVIKNLWVQERILSGTPLQPVESPVFLDRRGQVLKGFLTSNESGQPVDVSKLVKLKFHVQPQQKFNGVVPLV